MQTDIGLVFNALNINILQSTRPNIRPSASSRKKRRTIGKQSCINVSESITTNYEKNYSSEGIATDKGSISFGGMTRSVSQDN